MFRPRLLSAAVFLCLSATSAMATPITFLSAPTFSFVQSNITVVSSSLTVSAEPGGFGVSGSVTLSNLSSTDVAAYFDFGVTRPFLEGSGSYIVDADASGSLSGSWIFPGGAGPGSGSGSPLGLLFGTAVIGGLPPIEVDILAFFDPTDTSGTIFFSASGSATGDTGPVIAPPPYLSQVVRFNFYVPSGGEVTLDIPCCSIGSRVIDSAPATVPEPTTLTFLGTGLVVGLRRIRRFTIQH